MGGAIYSRNGNVDYTCRSLDCILTRKLKGIYCRFFIGGFIDANGSYCNGNDSMDVTDRPILCCPMLMALVMQMTLWVWDSNQLENVRVDISEICRPDLGMLSRFSTCHMKSQAGVQSQRRMYVSKLVIL